VALAGVKGYAEAHAAKVEALLASLAEGDPRRSSLATVAENLRHSPAQPARTFHQALQAIYLVHCALHWTVEVVPLGRLDQLLQPLLQADLDAKRLTLDEAQELVDCLWIKLDERVILDRRHAENRFTSCDGVLTGYLGASNFDQGGLINQWMQQVTIGGTLPDDDDQPNDACNDVTRLCLHAARRLPLNSPTLDLRVHAGTPEDVLALAARALLSGGAHPVLLNDDVIVPALAEHSGGEVPLRTARNYACDGCYETMFAGETEFSFGFVPALDALEKTLNRGAGIQAAGAVHLRGWKDSWRSKRAGEIADFEELWSILRDHVSLGCHRYVRSVLALYGNKAGVAPSPLLSALIRGCVERGRDLVDGGANYRIFSPLMVGVSNAADSLFVIEELVFKQRRFDLEELLTCLVTDWGDRLIVTDGEPRVAFGRHVPVHRIAEIRALCLEQPKFGSGDPRVDALAWRLLETFAECVREAVEHPVHREARARLEAKYGTEEHPFRLLFAPGVGTFEQYVFSGSFAGASPDGRRAGAPIASDLSPAPIPSDQPPTEVVAGVTRHRRTHRLADGLRSYAHEGAVLLGDGAPADFNLPEDTSPEALTEALRTFARGEGGSVCTFTVCDPSTFEEARRRPEDFNLLRVRMGGWTEFFVTLFPEHQEQHRRRPLYHA
ncbi:MAG: peroxidase, partial [Planctomycetota bacterium]|nr:peroxidase [Planctomycetota bacterium]